ncbi:MAG: glycosyltransferase family 4 protein [Planctomycetota bacterium]
MDGNANSRSFTVLHTEASPGWGGQEQRVFADIEGLRRHGHRGILAGPTGSLLIGRARRAGFPVIEMDFRGNFDIRAIRGICGVVRRERVDILHAHSSNDSWACVLAGILCRRPVVRTRHVDIPVTGIASRVLYGRITRRVIATSKGIARHLVDDVGLPESRIRVIPTGVDPARFHPGVPGDVFRREMGFPPGTPLVGIVSVVRRGKGHEELLEAAARLRQTHPLVRYIIAGDGNYVEQVRSAITRLGVEDIVRMIGHRDDVPDLLAALDVVTLPSHSEGTPQVILQALAMGRPVVASNVGGIPEIVEDRKNGLLVSPESSEALAAAIREILDNPTLGESLGAEAIARASDYIRERMWNRTFDLYMEILDGRA